MTKTKKNQPRLLTIMRDQEAIRVARKWCRSNVADVASRTGINFYWIAKFGRGEVPDPRISYLKRILVDMDSNTVE